MRTSLDLVQAMWNQREFIHTTVTKMKSKSKTLLKSDFPRAIKDYHDFLLLLKLQKPEDQDAILPTSWEVEMIWRLHMLHPPKYYRMMESQLGRVPNHNTIIHTSEIEQSHMRTRNAWEQVPPRLTRRVDVDQIKALAHRKGSKKNSRNSRYYNQLRSKFINGNMKNKISIALPEEQKDGFLKKKLLSKHHHGGDRKKQQPFLPIMTGETNSLNLDSIATVVEQVRKDILVNIAHTGHGYIGSIFDGERVYQEEMTTVSKRICKSYCCYHI
ncbi:hypothetical protein BDA99DRAFT_249733 [Phascolomyces articulosus]|uniref:Uncharacterized protein n=1 Tax=Phascolomyces articulosus TaxID=60185 RepID=A0AAD5KM16_9FUNG|nr:hypothetical protein BDA99DRAFT_249733 [Phascolomyces articulosus]